MVTLPQVHSSVPHRCSSLVVSYITSPSALEAILGEPTSGKQLRGELAAYRSFRVGKIRIIYRVKDKIIEVVAIGGREVIYYETTLLSRQPRRNP